MDTVVTDAPTETLRDFHCHGCGRRLFQYTADIGTNAQIRVRCRDCKTVSDLRGADVPALLRSLSHEGRADR